MQENEGKPLVDILAAAALGSVPETQRRMKTLTETKIELPGRHT